MIFILQYFHQEFIVWGEIPWSPVIWTAALGLIYVFLMHFGIAVTYPLFISIGALLAVPLSALVDRLFRGVGFGEFKILATLLIIVSFLLMLVPTSTVERMERKIRCCARSDAEDETSLLS